MGASHLNGSFTRAADSAIMQGRSPQSFGKRNRVVPTVAPARLASPRVALEADPHRAFFAAAMVETEADAPATGAVEVPRSLRAAILAGIVVACGLAGLDATQKIATLRGLTEAMSDQPQVRLLGPALILLAVLGGGRSAATSLLLAHGALKRAGQTGHLAYALGGAAAAAVFAAALMLVLGQAPAHGFAVDILAGAAGGFFYRVFAGTRSAAPGASR